MSAVVDGFTSTPRASATQSAIGSTSLFTTTTTSSGFYWSYIGPTHMTGTLPPGWGPVVTSTPQSDSASLAALAATHAGLVSDLRIALGALQIGLVFACITFGIVVTRAAAYFRSRPSDGIMTRATVAGLVFFNLVQIIATVHAVFTAVVPDFGDLYDLIAKKQWSVMLQIGFLTIAATIAQTFFACRLHFVKRNYFLTLAILLFTGVQFVFSWVAVGLMFEQGYIKVFLTNTENKWALIATFAVAGGINLVIAAAAYRWIQKPFMLQTRGRTTLMSQVEYWTVKGLFGCGVLSIFAAIVSAVMSVSMVWLAAAFSLGNLYTLSVLLRHVTTNLGPTLTSRPATITTLSLTDSRPHSVPDLAHRVSNATLTESDSEMWRDMIKAQMSKAAADTAAPRSPDVEVPPPPRYVLDEKTGYGVGTGHYVNDGAV